MIRDPTVNRGPTSKRNLGWHLARTSVTLSLTTSGRLQGRPAEGSPMTASSSTANPVGPLGDFLRLAREGTMPWGWIYFPTGTSEPDLQTTCILVTDSSVEVDASHRPVFAVERGFDVEGLDADAIEAIVDGARKFRDPPH